MTEIVVDLRELTGTPTDVGVPDARLSISMSVEMSTGGYLLTQNEYEVDVIDGDATFEAPVTGVGEYLRVRENGFRGARIKHLVIPAAPDPSNYGDLVEAS